MTASGSKPRLIAMTERQAKAVARNVLNHRLELNASQVDEGCVIIGAINPVITNRKHAKAYARARFRSDYYGVLTLGGP